MGSGSSDSSGDGRGQFDRHPDSVVSAYWRHRAWGDAPYTAARRAGVSRTTAYRWERSGPPDGFEAPEPGDEGGVPPPRSRSELGGEALSALDDFPLFRRRYLGRGHSPWQEDAARQMVTLLCTPRREFVVVNVAPGVGKTTLFCHDLIVWLICRNRRIRILVGSRSAALAGRSVGRIRRTLERTTVLSPREEDLARGMACEPWGVLAMDYGRFRPPPAMPAGKGVGPDVEESKERWTRTEFTVMPVGGESITEKEATVSAFGFDTRKLGPRLDLVVWDDLETSQTVRSVEGSRTLAEDFENEAETRLDPGGLFILQGQRLGARDLYRNRLDVMVPVMVGDQPGRDYDPELLATPLRDGPPERKRRDNPFDSLVNPPEPEEWLPPGQLASAIPTSLVTSRGAYGDTGILGWRRRYHHIVYPAHFEDRCAGLHDDRAPAALDPKRPGGCLLDPRRLPWYELIGHSVSNPTRYRVLYQQEDVDPEGVLVPSIWIDGGTDPATGEVFPGCWDTGRGRAEVPHPLPPGVRSIVTADPSPAKFWSIQWWLWDPPTERQWLMDLVRKPLAANDFIDWNHDASKFTGLLEDWWHRSVDLGVRITYVIPEANAAQKFLTQLSPLKRWSSLRSVSVIPHITGPFKMDPERGPEILKAHYRFGRVRLPGNYAAGGRDAAQPLVAEVTRYSDSTTDDCVMAHWFLVHQAGRLFPMNRSHEPTRLRRPSWMRDDRAPRIPAVFGG